MTPRLILIAITFACAGAIAPLSASAGIVTYAYGGVVDSDDAARGYTAFTGKFAYDTTATDQIADPHTADYKMGFWPLGMNVVFDGGAASASINDQMDVLVTNDLGGMDTIAALARTNDLLNSLGLTLFDFSATVLGNDGLPGGNLAFSDFGWGSFSWESVDGVLQGHLTDLTCLDGCDLVPPPNGGGSGGCQPGPAPCIPHDLPEPAAPALSLTGLAALMFSCRRPRKRKAAAPLQACGKPSRPRRVSHAGFAFGALTALAAIGAQAAPIAYHFKGHMAAPAGPVGLPVFFEGDVTYDSGLVDNDPDPHSGLFDGAGPGNQGISVKLTDGSFFSFHDWSVVQTADNQFGFDVDSIGFAAQPAAGGGFIHLYLFGTGATLANDALPDGHWTEADFSVKREFTLGRPGVVYNDLNHPESGQVDYFRCTAGCNSTPVDLPEPASWALVLAGLAAAARACRRHR